MATFSFSSLIGQTQSFSADSDVLSLSGDASNYLFVEVGSNTTVTDTSGNTATLTGFLLEQITTTNIDVASSDSAVIAGDNTTATGIDNSGQTTALDLVAAAGANVEANNLIYGLGGGDTIIAGNGDNLIFGGSGYVDTTDGSDSITINGSSSTSGSNRIYTNAGNDTVIFTKPTGNGETASVYGGAGNDNVITGAAEGTMHIYGGQGDDTVVGNDATGSLLIYGGTGLVDTTDGADAITTGLGSATVYGNAGADSLLFDDFTSGTQIIYAGLGDDTISGDVGGSGSSGALQAYGNAGSDYFDLTAHLGSATVYGGGGINDSGDSADTFLFGAGDADHDVTLYGNGGTDSFTSSASLAADETIIIYGGAGVDDFIISGARSATSSLTLYGNEGNDTYDVDDSTLAADATITFGGFESTDILTLTLSGGDATDLVVTGLGASVSINNTAGNGNYVFSDYTGGFTATNLVLSDGSALISNVGGAAASFTGTANADQIVGGSNGDTLNGGAGDDLVTGGGGADSITGGDDADSIASAAGNDTVDGGADADTVDGGEGSDSITGGTGADSLVGGLGNDTITGSESADSITGGIGADTFAYTYALVDATDTNVDIISDAFTEADVFDFTDLTSANLRGTGVTYASGSGTTGQALGANTGLYVATNAAADFTEANVYSALSGIADDLANGDIIYVMISNGTDARLVRITESANAGTLAAADDTMVFVARLSGVTNAELATVTEGNFADFT